MSNYNCVTCYAKETVEKVVIPLEMPVGPAYPDIKVMVPDVPCLQCSQCKDVMIPNAGCDVIETFIDKWRKDNPPPR